MERYFDYIGKAQAVDQAAPCHLLPYHLMDVAAVGHQALRSRPELVSDLADLLELSAEEVNSILVFGLLVHDLGKMTASFQSLFETQGLTRIPLQAGTSYDGKRARHDQLGFDVWQALTLPIGFTNENAPRTKRKLTLFLGIFWGHHGKPIWADKVVHDSLRITEGDLSAASAWLRDSLTLLDASFPVERFLDRAFTGNLKRASWLLAGFSTYCDWVGSDSTVFSYRDEPMPIAEYWRNEALPRAERALRKTEVFDRVRVLPFGRFESHFTFAPSPLQYYAATVELAQSPSLFILEDVTGSGKTEAALVLAHRLLQETGARGFYVGLPTMATSNAMFERVAEHYSKMVTTQDGQLPSIVLAHGASRMNELFRQASLGESVPDSPYGKNEQTASLHCSDWLADNRKIALLAPVGVGTVDQALLAVLPKKHQSLRVLGLYGKVLVLDEVHAADTYMFELMDALLTLHASQGGSAILLSATLPIARREQLTAIWQKALGASPEKLRNTTAEDFPLATQVSLDEIRETQIACRPGSEKYTAVQFVHTEEECIEKIVAAVADRRCVVWIRNSVDEAISAYERIIEHLDEPENCLLFHSRFILRDRKAKENWVLRHFGKTSGPDERAGRVLIATQVFQESLDADADLMISDLCLIDDLIQRSGRLYRHARDEVGQLTTGPDQRPNPMLFVNAPQWQQEPDSNWLSDHSPNTQYVYQTPGKIWLTMQYLRERKELRLPDQAREMIEYVYGPDASIPPALERAELEFQGKERGSRNQGRVNRLDIDQGYCDASSPIWLDDDTEVGTRLDDQQASRVVLVRRMGPVYQPVVDNPEFGAELSSLAVRQQLLRDLDEIDPIAREDFVKRHRSARYAVIIDIEYCADRYSERYGWRNPRECH